MSSNTLWRLDVSDQVILESHGQELLPLRQVQQEYERQYKLHVFLGKNIQRDCDWYAKCFVTELLEFGFVDLDQYRQRMRHDLGSRYSAGMTSVVCREVIFKLNEQGANIVWSTLLM